MTAAQLPDDVWKKIVGSSKHAACLFVDTKTKQCYIEAMLEDDGAELARLLEAMRISPNIPSKLQEKWAARRRHAPVRDPPSYQCASCHRRVERVGFCKCSQKRVPKRMLSFPWARVLVGPAFVVALMMMTQARTCHDPSVRVA